jgi:uncharacterized protein
MKKIILSGVVSVSILLLFFSFITNGENSQDKCAVFPDPVSYVNDFENLMSREECQMLDGLIKKHEQETSNQIAVVTVSTIEPYEDFFNYTLDLASCWGMGQKDKNNGVLIAINTQLRIVRIQNGLGIEEILTDEETKVIIDTQMTPEFAKGNFYSGLKAGIEAIFEEIK